MWQKLSLFLIISVVRSEKINIHPDAGLNISQLLDKHGYPFEKHVVETEDGYLLEIHRIPHGINNVDTNRTVVLLAHGLLSQSIDFLNNEPEKSLGFILANKGYDVWLTNNRGNTYSRRHKSLDPDSKNKKIKKQFWDFSNHELGSKDFPAVVDFILKTTGQSNLHLVGHSQGTTASFIFLAEHPEYNDKIRSLSALAPAAFMSRSLNPFFKLGVKYLLELQLASNLLNVDELLRHMKIYRTLIERVCYDSTEGTDICKSIYFALNGHSPNEFNITLLSLHLSNSPSGSSTKAGLHYLQSGKTNTFRPYDYGPIGNMKKYGKLVPTDYKLSNVKVPVAIYYSEGDLATSYKDVEFLATKLPNIIRMNKSPDKNFGHLDFVWGNNVVKYVYDAVLEDIEKY